MIRPCGATGCPRVGTVPGLTQRFHRVSLCQDDARRLWLDCDFLPDDPSLLRKAPAPSVEEQATLDRFEAAPPAPESFDAVAAVRRLQDLADELERPVVRSRILPDYYNQGKFDGEDLERSSIARRIREAIRGDTA